LDKICLKDCRLHSFRIWCLKLNIAIHCASENKSYSLGLKKIWFQIYDSSHKPLATKRERLLSLSVD
jgi:hypothetical protein